MRRRNVHELSELAPGSVLEVSAVDEGAAARSMMVARFGPSCAAWLVGKHRRQIRRTGAVDLHIPWSAELPMWFALAVACLRERAGWDVEEPAPLLLGQRPENRTFRLRWLVKLPYTAASA